jgi:hypothetical protein
MATEHKPTGTRIFSVPVTINGVDASHTCILYINSLQTGKGGPALMIVPFPNPGGASRIGLVDASACAEFRRRAQSQFAQYEVRDRKLAAKSSNLETATSLGYAPVLEVGNYKCSVVPNAAELFTHIDWSQFTAPADLEARLSVAKDTAVVPADCGFVVCEALKNVTDDGFGVVYPGRQIFFPTCHEGNGATHDYDVCCYGFNCLVQDASVTLSGREFEAGEAGKDAWRGFANKVTWSDTGTTSGLSVPDLFCGSFLHLKGEAANMNLLGTVADGLFGMPVRIKVRAQAPPMALYEPVTAVPAPRFGSIGDMLIGKATFKEPKAPSGPKPGAGSMKPPAVRMGVAPSKMGLSSAGWSLEDGGFHLHAGRTSENEDGGFHLHAGRTSENEDGGFHLRAGRTGDNEDESNSPIAHWR